LFRSEKKSEGDTPVTRRITEKNEWPAKGRKIERTNSSNSGVSKKKFNKKRPGRGREDWKQNLMRGGEGGI